MASASVFGLSLSVALARWALMGRNGWARPPPCRSIMGLTPARAGMIRFSGYDVRTLPFRSGSRKGHWPGAGRSADYFPI